MVCGLDRSGGLSAVLRLARVVFMAAVSGLAAGCTMSGAPTLDLPSLNAAPHTVAFEVIEGAPDRLWHDKFVARLNQEANARKIASVSQTQPSQYVIRGYVAANVQGQKTTITWVWDVFSTPD